MIKSLATIVVVVVAVIFLSLISVKVQGHKEENSGTKAIVVNESMTIGQFGEVNGIANPHLKKVLQLESKNDLNKNILQAGLTREQLIQRFTKDLTLKAEYESRNWIKIPLKFILTIGVLVLVFIFLRKRKITTTNRIIFLGSSVFVFGVLLGSDPNPMGTVKDAIVLFGTKHVIFPPRMVALTLFLLMVLLANKFICSWACQFGTLQDLLFQLGRKKERNGKVFIPQFKVPFVVTNTIRVVFFVLLSAAALFIAVDIVNPIDPFKVFNPAKLGILGAIFAGLILVMSVFIYRPWCHFFCPFGLVGWLLEKISIFKIQVNYDTCIACRKCEQSCPSSVMGAILKRDRIIPDCFPCGICIEACPTKSISFNKGRRTNPPHGKFHEVG